MNRRLVDYPLAVALISLAAGCHPDLCDGIGQACLSVRLEGSDDVAMTQSDRLRVFVSQNGAAAIERQTTPAAMQPAALPIAFTVLLGDGGSVDLDVIGELANMAVLRGQGHESVAAGEHKKLTITMSAGDGSRPAETPPPRLNAGYAYFPERHAVVLYGGQTATTGGQFFGDTWEYDPTLASWRRMVNSSAPQARTARLTYDPRRKALILFGGVGDNNRAFADTWVYGSDGKWSALELFTSPSPRSHAALTYDYFRDAVELYGGKDLASGNVLSDAWELPLSANAWSPRGQNGVAPIINDARLVFDGRYTLLVGSDETAQTPIKVYRVDVGAFTELVPPTTMPPSRRSEIATAFDRRAGGLFLFGGGSAGSPVSDSFHFSPTDYEWTPGMATGPSARSGAYLDYVPELSGLLLFGGQIAGGSLSVERWLLRDGAWQQLP